MKKFVLLLTILAGIYCAAQDPKKPEVKPEPKPAAVQPTSEQKLAIENAELKAELAQLTVQYLQLQAAATSFQLQIANADMGRTQSRAAQAVIDVRNKNGWSDKARFKDGAFAEPPK